MPRPAAAQAWTLGAAAQVNQDWTAPDAVNHPPTVVVTPSVSMAIAVEGSRVLTERVRIEGFLERPQTRTTVAHDPSGVFLFRRSDHTDTAGGAFAMRVAETGRMTTRVLVGGAAVRHFVERNFGGPDAPSSRYGFAAVFGASADWPIHARIRMIITARLFVPFGQTDDGQVMLRPGVGLRWAW